MSKILDYIFKNFDATNWSRTAFAFAALSSVHIYIVIRSFDTRAFSFVDATLLAKLSVDFFIALALATFAKAGIVFFFDAIGGTLFPSPYKYVKSLGRALLNFGTERSLFVDLVLTVLVFILIYAPGTAQNPAFLGVLVFFTFAHSMHFIRKRWPEWSPLPSEDSTYIPESSDLTFITLLAFAFAVILGDERAEFLVEDNKMSVTLGSGEHMESSLLGFTSFGGIFIDSEKKLQLVPFSAIYSITALKPPLDM